MIIKQPFEYPLIASIDGINVHALPDFEYFISFEERSCYVRFRGAGFTWVEPWLAKEWNDKIENAIITHELKGIL